MKAILHLFVSCNALLSSVAPAAQSNEFGVDGYVEGPNARTQFGQSVNGAGDVNQDGFDDFMVGAPDASPAGVFGAGSVFVYSGVDKKLILQIDGTKVQERIGSVIAPAGDINADGHDDLLVGAPVSGFFGATQCGAVRVYSGYDASMLFEVWGSNPFQHLGRTVSATGDIDGDGCSDFIAGSKSPFAIVYSGADGTELFQLPLTTSNWAYQVAGGGDVNADGVNDFIVSDPSGEYDQWNEYGAVYVYSGLNGALLYQLAGTRPYDGFGSRIAFGGDMNADGNDDFIVHASGTDSYHGHVFVYSGFDGSLLHQLAGNYYQGLGAAICPAGDWNRDGFDDFLVGSPHENQPANGKVEIYSGFDSTLLYRYAPGAEFRLGLTAGFIGDRNGDGHPNLIAGAPWRDGPDFQGSAVVLGAGPILKVNKETISLIQGGTLKFEMRFPLYAAGLDYKVLLSAHGTGPTFFGVRIPLTYDAVFYRSANGHYPVVTHTDMHGTLDANAHGYAEMIIPAGMPTSYLGLTLHAAAVAHPAGGVPELASIARPVTLTLY